MPLPLFSTEASGFPPSAHTQPRLPAPSAHSRFGEPFATVCAARQNGTCMPPLALFGAGSSRIHRGRKRPKKRVRTARGRGCKASRPFGAYATEASSPRFAPCGAGSSTNPPRAEETEKRVRTATVSPAKLSGLPALLFCLVLEQVLRRILHRRAGRGLQTGRHAAAGRGYLSRLKS